MKYFGLTLNLKDDPKTIASYKKYHRNVWPEVESSLRRVGITGMKIFLLGRRMFMYLETRDDFEPARDFAKYLEELRCAEWDQLMRTFQEVVPEAKPGELWALMEPVYELK